MSLESKVETEAFKRRSRFARIVKTGVKHLVMPKIPEQYRNMEQFDASSRNVEILLEGFLKMMTRHPIKTALCLDALADFSRGYFPEQGQDKRRYLICTEHDEKIPFRGEDDIMYGYMLAQLAYIGYELTREVSLRSMKRIVAGVKEMHKIGSEAFRKHPTVMQRRTEHDRLTLGVLQMIDKPYNCAPSLHIAYSIFLDNLAERYVIDKDVFDSIRYSTIRMFNSVLYTKQHSLLDVAFGILCAKMAFEKHFPGEFNDFVDMFDEMRKEFPEIDYGNIRHIYEEAKDMPGSLADRLGLYLERNGFVKVDTNIDLERAYFHTEKREIMNLPQLA